MGTRSSRQAARPTVSSSAGPPPCTVWFCVYCNEAHDDAALHCKACGWQAPEFIRMRALPAGVAKKGWVCAVCGEDNAGTECSHCGSPAPAVIAATLGPQVFVSAFDFDGEDEWEDAPPSALPALAPPPPPPPPRKQPLLDGLAAAQSTAALHDALTDIAAGLASSPHCLDKVEVVRAAQAARSRLGADAWTADVAVRFHALLHHFQDTP